MAKKKNEYSPGFSGWCEWCGRPAFIDYYYHLCGRCGRGLSGRLERWRLRMEVLRVFGGRCACCGESEPDFLDLDHVHDDGKAERAEEGTSWSTIWKRAIAEGPGGRYQLLCCNCNHGKRRNHGVCPHALQYGFPKFGAIFPKMADFRYLRSRYPRLNRERVAKRLETKPHWVPPEAKGRPMSERMKLTR